MIDCNPPASQFLSGTADAVRENCPLTDLAPPGADIGRVASESARLMADAREAYATDGRVLGADRSEFFLSISKTLPRDLDSDELCGLVTVARDIAQRLRLEGANLDASERERRSIGGDLHDGLDQELSGLGLLLAVAARRESRIANRESRSRRFGARSVAPFRTTAAGLCIQSAACRISYSIADGGESS